MNRISQQSLFSKINYDLNRITYEMSRLNEAIASGKRVNRLSDDILGGASILAIRSVLSDLEQYGRDLSVASEWLNTSESAVMNIKTTLTEALTLAEQMSTDTYMDSNLKTAALAIEDYIKEIIQSANTTLSGRYLFGGSMTDSSPFTEDLNIHKAQTFLSIDSAYTGTAVSSGSYTGDLTKTYMARIVSSGGVMSAQAALTTNLDAANDDLTFTAVEEGAGGEDITIQYVDPGGAQALSVSVTGTDIVVTLGHDGTNITSTAAEVMNAINTDAQASALVSASTAAGSDASGVIGQAMGPLNLSRGASTAALTNNFAALTTGFTAANSNLHIVANDPGSDGSDIRIGLIDPGAANQSLSISVSGNDIIVSLATDAAGNIVTTGGQLEAALNADPQAGALVTASPAGINDGSGVVQAMGFTSLSAGSHNDLQFKALIPGTDGNKISITYIDPGAADTALSINVVNPHDGSQTYDIQVTLATDSDGNIISTAQDVLEAIENHVPAVADPPYDMAAGDLIDVSLAAGSSGLGVINQVGTWNLSGGMDTAATFQISEDGGLTWGGPTDDPADVFLASLDGVSIYNGLTEDGDLGVELAFTEGGTLTADDIFTVDVNHYLGNDQELEVNIERNYRVQTNLTGTELMGDTGDENNILDCLNRLRQALADNDTVAVGDEIPILKDILEDLSASMATLGVRINRVEMGQNTLETTKYNSTQRLSDLEDLDLIQAVTDLSNKQMAYEATLASTSMITQLSLLDYIK